MTEKQLKEIHEIADTLGYEEQSMQLIEEMGELMQGINKHRRYGKYETYINIAEEIVDVKIMLEQIEYLLGYNSKQINCFIDEKIERTRQRLLENGENI